MQCIIWWWLPLRSLRTLGALSRLSERKLHFYQLCQPQSQGDICLPSSFTGSWLSARWGFRCCSTTMRLPADPRLSFINTLVVETNWWVYQQSICCCEAILLVLKWIYEFLVHARSALDNIYATLQNLNFVLTLMNAVQHWWPDPLKIVSAEMSFSGRLKTRSLRER